MEHIPLPEGVKHFIRAPYNASRDEWYRKEGFAKYPEAHGWAEADINGENGFGNREPKQIQNFFQTWLYFALVQDFFALAHINTTTEDFLKPKDPRSQTRVVDSSKLVTLLAQWQELLRDSNEDLDDVWDKVNGMFKKVKLIVNRFCTPALDDDGLPPDEGNQVPSWPVQDEVSTTIITLVVALEEAALQVCHKAVGADRTPYLTARSVVLQRRLERMWCLADASMLLDEMKVDGHYFLAASPSPGEEYMQEHSACTRRSCRFAFDENFYETKHADYPWHSEGCRTQAPYGGHIGSGNGEKDWEDTVCGIIGREAIPIALWNPRLRNLWSAEYHLKGPKKPDYVAISHVYVFFALSGYGYANKQTRRSC
ncbi:hypothetical protein EIK77_005865 [Talaromyces pinophilus]|nr:hypothetical protein EIK77_005865 [Talaromyces pinophilus]